MRAALCTLFLLAAPAAAAPPLAVGFGEADVSPVIGEKPVFLAGFGHGRKATKVHDPLMARAVVLASGDDKIALVCADVVGLFYSSAERVRAKLPGFRYVLVSATHTHHGPDTLGLWGANPFTSGVDPDYLAKVEAGCVAAVKQADTARRPATVRIGTASDASLLNDLRLPVVKHDELVAIQFLDPQTAKPVGVLVQWNCHPEELSSQNTEVTADFVASTVAHLKGVYGCPVAYFSGTLGGMMTTIRLPVNDEAGKPLPDGTFPKAGRYGVLLGKLAEKAVAASTPATLTPFEARTRTVLVPVQNSLYLLAGKLGTLKRDMYHWAGVPGAKPVVADDVSKPVAIRTEVGYLKLGDLEIAVIPGEIYPELVLGKVQEPVDPGADFPTAAVEPAVYPQLKGKHRLIVGMGNDEIGYLIPKRQWDEKPPFCYGRTTDQYGEKNSLGPDAAGIILNTFRDLVGKKD